MSGSNRAMEERMAILTGRDPVRMRHRRDRARDFGVSGAGPLTTDPVRRHGGSTSVPAQGRETMKNRAWDWTHAHPWTVLYLCVVATLDLIANVIEWLA
jgi:hypothetical protein